MARHTDWPCVWWPRIEAALGPKLQLWHFLILGRLSAATAASTL